MTVGCARGNNKQVSQWTLTTNISHVDINRLEVFKGGNDQVAELFS